MKPLRGILKVAVVCIVVSGCSSEDFNLAKIASTSVSGFTEKLGDISLSKIGQKIGIKTEPRIKLEPAPLPIYAVGDTFVYSSEGALVQEQVVNVSSGRVTWTNDKGMLWTTSSDIITPQLSWSSHHELGRGRQTIIGNPETLFPLREGNTVAFGIRGNSENMPTGWRDEKKCVVAGQQDVNVTAGDFTTFHISCTRKGIKEDLYYSPVVQNYVLRVREFTKKRAQKELVSVQLENDRTKNISAKLTRPKKERQSKLKKLEVPANLLSGTKRPTSGNADVDALIAKLEKMIKRIEKAAPRQSAKPARGKTTAKEGGKYGIHLASYRSLKGARKGWKALKRKHRKELKDLDFATSEFDSGKRGTFIRLLGISFKSKASANKFCKKLKAKRQYCKGERARP